jgi:hypothetical protein
VPEISKLVFDRGHWGRRLICADSCAGSDGAAMSRH